MCKLNNKSQKHFKYYFLNQKKNPQQFNCTGNFTTKAKHFLYKIPVLGVADD